MSSPGGATASGGWNAGGEHHSHLEWELEFGAGEMRELCVRYSIEHPHGEQLELLPCAQLSAPIQIN